MTAFLVIWVAAGLAAAALTEIESRGDPFCHFPLSAAEVLGFVAFGPIGLIFVVGCLVLPRLPWED